MSDLYRAGFEYGYNNDTRLIDQLPLTLSESQRLEFERGRLDGERRANAMGVLFVSALLASVVGLFWWMTK